MTESDSTRISEISRAAIRKAWTKRFYRWRAYALSLTGNKTDAEEIVQEAITRTMNAAPELATEQDAYHYVISAIRSSAYQMFGRRGRRRQVTENTAPPVATSDPLCGVLQTEALIERQELRRAAVDAVRELKPVHREVVELLVLRDPPMKLREVAAIQNAPVSTVYSRLQSALRSIGRLLAEDIDE